MPQISHIRHSDIKLAQRFDAEYFKPEYLEIEKELFAIGFIELGDKKASKLITDGDHGNPEYSDVINDMCYIKVEQLSDIDVDLSNSQKITKKCVEGQSKTNFTEELDILLSMKGTLGKTSIVINNKRAVLNRDVAKIQVNRDLFNPFFVFTYLKSRMGISFINKFASGAVQQGLYLNKIQKIKIPLLPESFQLSIEEIVKGAHQKQSDSKSFYAEAEQLLLSELGLLDYQVRNTLAFSTTRSAVRDAGRYDSEYFQPKYDEIIKRIEGYDDGYDTIGNIVKWKKGYEVGAEAYGDEGKDFIRVSDFTTHGISDDCKKISASLFDELKKSYQPKKGEILFTKDGSIGITHVLKEEREGILSGAFLRLILKEEYQDFEKECLALILNSLLCRMQVEKLSGGALIAHLKPSDFETFKIPLIKPSIQSQIAEKIQESHRLRKESRELLERAKKMVEEEIENGVEK